MSVIKCTQGALFNEVYQKNTISCILWYSDWLHNTLSAGNSIFVSNHDTTSGGRSIMCAIRLPKNIRNIMINGTIRSDEPYSFKH